MVKIGVIGCSAIAERSTIPAIIENKNFNLMAIGSRFPEKALKLASRYNCIAATYDEILENDGIDAVYLPLPSGLHYSWGMKALKAGKHILLEKPFADSYVGAKELIDYAQREKLIAMECLTYVYHPLTTRVLGLINNNEIGEIRSVEASFGFPFLPSTDIRNDPSLGGGAILDNLIYPLSFCLKVIQNKYERVSYHIVPDENYKIDARGFLRIDTDKLSVAINYGFGFYYRNCFTIWGEKGIIEADRVFTRPKDMPGEIILKKHGVKTIITIDAADQFGATIQAFYSKITNNDNSGINEAADILVRTKIISDMYSSFCKRKKE